jgi:hypothetical protein
MKHSFVTGRARGSTMALKPILLILLAAVVTLELQQWIGRLTIYHADMAKKRLLLHDAIILNEPLPGGWHANGANGINIRILTPSLAELTHRLTGIPLLLVYRLIDTVSLFFILILFFWFLHRWSPPEYCLIGVLYFSLAVVLTYFFHYFQPWDRLALLSWILLLFLLRDGRLLLFTLGMVIGITIKWDLVLIPALYWLNEVTRASWRRPTAVTIGLFAISFGTAGLLRMVLFPGGFDKYDEPGIFAQVSHQILVNWNVMLENIVAYPPLLVFTLPAFLGILGLKQAPRFVIACFVFGVVLVVPFFLLSNFIEVRAHMASLVLITPAALIGLRNLLR